MGHNSQENEILPSTISSLYPYDGDPIYDTFTNPKGLKLFGYKWRANDPGAIIIAVHGIQSHCRFEYLCHPYALPDDMSPQLCTYQGSWAQIFNQHSITFCGLDLQGHGFSEGWQKSRCNIEAFDDMINDVITYIKRVVKQETEFLNNPAYFPPIFLMGISMGGCIILRTLEQLTLNKDSLIFPNSKEQVSPNKTIFQPSITGCIGLSSMLSLEKSKKQLAGRILLRFGDFASKNFPHLKVAAIGKNILYPLVDKAKELDPLVSYPSRVAMRLSYELIKGLDLTQNDAHIFPIHLRVLFMHSVNDTQCEMEGVDKFYNKISNKDKTLLKLTSFWHCLTHETGTNQLIDDIINWIFIDHNPGKPKVSKI